ncbi:MAG: hypothetical protein ACKV0T_11210 [Planctomycetales bacterium]
MNVSLASVDPRHRSIGPRWQTRAWRWALCGLMVTSCACSTTNRPMAIRGQDPFLAAEQDQAPSNPLNNEAAAGRSSLGRSQWQPGQEIALAEYRSGRQPDPAADRAVQQVRAEARMPLPCPPQMGECPRDRLCDQAGDCAACDERFDDEYLCDGGDRGLPVHYDRDAMQGLETEDTVVEYYDPQGKRRVKPTNRVCIYAPRFGSIVSVGAPLEDVGGGRPTQAVGATHGVGFQNRAATVAHNHNGMTERLVSRVRGSGLRASAFAEELDRPEAIQGHIHTTVPLIDFGFLASGQIQGHAGPELARQVQAAVAWTRDQNPVIAAVTSGANELKSRFTPSALVGDEKELQRKLRIVKLADKEIAAAGDVVTFKIRFDNLGDIEARDVVIVDNLTPRLEYIEGSAECTLEGELFTAENGEGGVILRWELAAPLEGGTGGVLTFQARIR